MWGENAMARNHLNCYSFRDHLIIQIKPVLKTISPWKKSWVMDPDCARLRTFSIILQAESPGQRSFQTDFCAGKGLPIPETKGFVLRSCWGTSNNFVSFHERSREGCNKIFHNEAAEKTSRKLAWIWFIFEEFCRNPSLIRIQTEWSEWLTRKDLMIHTTGE